MGKLAETPMGKLAETLLLKLFATFTKLRLVWSLIILPFNGQFHLLKQPYSTHTHTYTHTHTHIHTHTDTHTHIHTHKPDKPSNLTYTFWLFITFLLFDLYLAMVVEMNLSSSNPIYLLFSSIIFAFKPSFSIITAFISSLRLAFFASYATVFSAALLSLSLCYHSLSVTTLSLLSLSLCYHSLSVISLSLCYHYPLHTLLLISLHFYNHFVNRLSPWTVIRNLISNLLKKVKKNLVSSYLFIFNFQIWRFFYILNTS